jgi:hypothetical protein
MRACGSPTTRLCRLAALILVVAGAWGLPVVARAQGEIPPEVRQALERNARAFAPVALMLEKQRTPPQAPTEVTKRILGIFPGFLKPCTYEYLSQDGLCYARYNEWQESTSLLPGPDRGQTKLTPKWTELSWDGKAVFRGAESLQPKILSIVPIGKVESDGELSISTWYRGDDYFRMIGIAVPCAMKELPEGPHSEVLRLVGGDGRVTGARTERLAGGTEHFVVDLLSGDKRHRFWLDPLLGHAVRRHEVWAASGALAVVIDNSDFVKLTGPDLWLPRHCHADWHTWPIVADKDFTRDTTMVVDIQATRVERTRVPLEKFALKYDKPGTLISDGRLPGAEQSRDGRIDYIAPADSNNLEEAIRAGQQRSGYVPPRRPLFVWIIVGSIALGAAAGAIVLIRRRRGRPPTR